MEAANKCPACGQIVDDENYLPFAEKCRRCYTAEIDAKIDELENLFIEIE
jgi:endogenous inhibitor of DNA gyrase (YacG/DUF329 family)